LRKKRRKTGAGGVTRGKGSQQAISQKSEKKAFEKKSRWPKYNLIKKRKKGSGRKVIAEPEERNLGGVGPTTETTQKNKGRELVGGPSVDCPKRN